MEAAARKIAMKELEDKVLQMMAESVGDLLEDDSALNFLDAAKKSSSDMNQQQEAIMTVQ